MASQLLIGNFSQGLRQDRLPFAIDNDSFPVLYNAYSWRGRVKRKRGTVPLARLQIQLSMQPVPNNYQAVPVIGVLDGSGNGSGNFISTFSLPASSSIALIRGSYSLVDGTNTYRDVASNGVLVGTPGGSGTINYATGALTISGGVAGNPVYGTVSYYPNLPVMGLEDLVTTNYQYPVLMAFDTLKSYQLVSGATPSFYNVNYYKSINNPFSWTGATYQQFWTINYSTNTAATNASVLWATNNVAGAHFENISSITAANPTVITTGSAHNLITGDYVWFNEITGADASFLNGQTTSITKTGANTFTVPIDTSGKAINNNGIFQTLTHSVSGDGIRWYDGDPTSGTGIPTATGKGWVNFSPPLTATTTPIEGITSGLYYLVGAKMIVPFKDRLLFLSPWVRTSSGGAVQLQDTILWSWNGTPYYNSLTPNGETYDPTAYYIDQTGKGGYLSAGIAQAIQTVGPNEDVLLVGFTNRQTRFIYTGNDLNPFLFYSINNEYGSGGTFSAINLDRGVLAIGNKGLTITSQESCQRIDLQIPNQIFQIEQLNHGLDRTSAGRDFYHEWIHFAFAPQKSQWDFPTQTLQFNYRENNWGLLYENFTTFGLYRPSNGYTWATIPFSTWNDWNEPWDSAISQGLVINMVAGNPQGFVVIKGEGTGEAPTGYISGIANQNGESRITSNDHCLQVGDYLYFQSCIGQTFLNSTIGRVINVSSANVFDVDIDYVAGTYLGLGTFQRLSRPFIQTKQFPTYWDQGRQVRIGVQKYLLDKTSSGQVTLNIYLSQNPNDVWNMIPIYPDENAQNNSIVYSQVLFTCPEPGNLQMENPNSQFQIWHRINTSLIGDTVQLGITLSDDQMRDYTYSTSEIGLHAIIMDLFRSRLLA